MQTDRGTERNKKVQTDCEAGNEATRWIRECPKLFTYKSRQTESWRDRQTGREKLRDRQTGNETY